MTLSGVSERHLEAEAQAGAALKHSAYSKKALGKAVRSAGPSEPIFVDAGSTHQYLYVLFYGYADPRRFQSTRQLSLDADNLYHVASFDRFFFDRAALPPGGASRM
jgi:hypothetical protein